MRQSPRPPEGAPAPTGSDPLRSWGDGQCLLKQWLGLVEAGLPGVENSQVAQEVNLPLLVADLAARGQSELQALPGFIHPPLHVVHFPAKLSPGVDALAVFLFKES